MLDTTLGAAFEKAASLKARGTIKREPKQPKPSTAIVLPTDEAWFGTEYADSVDTQTIGTKRGRKGKVRLADLNLDATYQYRPETEPGRIADLEKWLKDRGGFDPLEAGAIHVNRRRSGKFFIMDGGGRSWMALRAGLETIDAIVFDGVSWNEEKEFFIRKNSNKRTIRAPHLFRVTASSGVEPHATIVKLLDEAGYGMERLKGDKKRALFAPASLLHTFYLDGTGDILRLTLQDIRNTVGDQKGTDGRLLVTVGMLRFCGAGRDQVKLRHIILHDPAERDATVSLDQSFAAARALTTGIITSRTVQSRDLNPFLFKLFAARFNFKKPQGGSFRIVPTDVLRAKDRFSTPDLIDRWGEKTLYKDTWSWKYC